MKLRNAIWLLALLPLVTLLTSCRKDVYSSTSELQQVPGAKVSSSHSIIGLYLLNNGGKGNNETTLDYMDLTAGAYHRNIYSEKNPDAEPTLGDNGLDIRIHKGKLYIVVNNSHRVIVLDAYTTKRLGEIKVNDCRSIAFSDARKEGYITSYLRPNTPEDRKQLGEVIRFNTETLQITGHVTVGCQPNECAVFDDYLYVCNSGMYNGEKRDNTISIISLESFTQISKLEVPGISPYLILNGEGGRARYMWVGTYGRQGIDRIPANMSNFTVQNSGGGLDEKIKTYPFPIVSMCMTPDMASVYFLRGEHSLKGYVHNPHYNSYEFVGAKWHTEEFVNASVKAEIENPTSIAVGEDYEVYITDARNYTSSGLLYCVDRKGNFKWKVRTGIIPIKVALLKRR